MLDFIKAVCGVFITLLMIGAVAGAGAHIFQALGEWEYEDWKYVVGIALIGIVVISVVVPGWYFLLEWIYSE